MTKKRKRNLKKEQQTIPTLINEGVECKTTEEKVEAFAEN